jgi:hypothetical protein
MAVYVIKPSPGQWKSLRRKIHHRRRKIDLAIKPRLHSVLIGRDDVGEMIRHQRSHMACDYFIADQLVGRRTGSSQPAGQYHNHQDGGRRHPRSPGQ